MSIFDILFERTSTVLRRGDVPMDNMDVPRVAREIAVDVTGVVTNATNAEPWYKSRIYWGLIAAALGVGLSRFGIIITGEDLQTLVELGTELITAFGVLYALYGRIVGSSKPPLGG